MGGKNQDLVDEILEQLRESQGVTRNQKRRMLRELAESRKPQTKMNKKKRKKLVDMARKRGRLRGS